MAKTVRVALVGATGLLGRELLNLLAEKKFPAKELRAFASEHSVGESVAFGDDELEVEALTADAFAHCDLAFFCVPAKVAEHYVPLALQAGCLVLDASRAFRRDSRSLMLVPGLQSEALSLHRGLIVLPASASLVLLYALWPLHEEATLTRLVITALQPVSLAGQEGIQELEKQVSDLLNMREISCQCFPAQIAFNVLPVSGELAQDEYSTDEEDFACDLARVLDAPDLAVTANCVQVPIFYGHGLSLNVETSKKLSAKTARALLSQAYGVRVLDNPGATIFPTPIDCTGEPEVFVGRIREDQSRPAALNLWICADNLRRGSALSLCELALELVEGGYLEREWDRQIWEADHA
ncbi:MAG: aspartate-semialdehyde dehydrogenase [Desulfovibrio sp.]|nr:aspartate-semialdehyde dehydrogenase [Desulfovibrio sp.]